MSNHDRKCCCCLPLWFGVLFIGLVAVFELICVATIFRLDDEGNRAIAGVNTYNLLARVVIVTLFFVLVVNAKNKISRGALYYSYMTMVIIDFVMFSIFTGLSFLLNW